MQVTFCPREPTEPAECVVTEEAVDDEKYLQFCNLIKQKISDLGILADHSRFGKEYSTAWCVITLTDPGDSREIGDAKYRRAKEVFKQLGDFIEHQPSAM